MLFHLQNRVSVLSNFYLEPRFWAESTLCSWNSTYFLMKSEKRNSRHGSEDVNVKINVCPNIPLYLFTFQSYCISSNFFFQKKKWVLSFALRDKWTVNYFSIVLYDEDYILQYEWKKNCVATNFIIIAKAKYTSVTKQSEIFIQRNSFVFVAAFNGYSCLWLLF